MSFGAGLFRIGAMIRRHPIMSFDFGARKMYVQSPQKSFIFYSADPYYLRDFLGPLLRVPNFYFSEGPNVRRGGPIIKEGPTLIIGHMKRLYTATSALFSSCQ